VSTSAGTYYCSEALALLVGEGASGLSRLPGLGRPTRVALWHRSFSALSPRLFFWLAGANASFRRKRGFTHGVRARYKLCSQARRKHLCRRWTKKIPAGESGSPRSNLQNQTNFRSVSAGSGMLVCFDPGDPRPRRRTGRGCNCCALAYYQSRHSGIHNAAPKLRQNRSKYSSTGVGGLAAQRRLPTGAESDHGTVAFQ
jgi:hypothetical protein